MQESEVRIFYDHDVTGRILDVIKNATEHLVLVSPYVDRVDRVEQQLRGARVRGVDVTVVVRRDENALGGRNGADAVKWFVEQAIPVIGVPNLHAKFYMNDAEGVVTSMNLLNSSWLRSLEFGMTVSGTEHQRLRIYYNELKNLGELVESSVFAGTAAANSIAKKEPTAKSSGGTTASNERKTTHRKPAAKDPPKTGRFGAIINAVKEFIAPSGYCIRCGEQLSAADVERNRVLCDKDYRSWARYKDDTYVEKFCANCGNKARTSYAKPLCQDCYSRG